MLINKLYHVRAVIQQNPNNARLINKLYKICENIKDREINGDHPQAGRC